MSQVFRITIHCMLLFVFSAMVSQKKDTLFVYGSGGPTNPIKECAQVFSTKYKIGGVETRWIENAKKMPI